MRVASSNEVKRVVLNLLYTELDITNILFAAEDDEQGYNNALIKINEYSVLYTIRILVTIPDGTVMFDTAKGELNTYANFKGKLINENHNSRSAILQALLGNWGAGSEQKRSTSTGLYEYYFAHRLGPSINDVQFIIRGSKT
jgi:hypothetical protein